MRLLIVTQKVDVNDSVLGFFHAWIREFAKHFDQVTVIGLSLGSYDLPKNVTVRSLGKEKGAGRIIRTLRFLRYIFSEKYDLVFVHMNPMYTVLAGWWWRLVGKKVALWYVHRNVDLKLRAAVFFSHVVFTASPEGCRVESKKVKAIGHGIDVDLFRKSMRMFPIGEGECFCIAHIGRITPIKNCDVIIEACALLKTKIKRPIRLTFVGETVTKGDETYRRALEALLKEKGLEKEVMFLGTVGRERLPVFLGGADCTVNATPTGGLDKAVIESMAAGVPAFTSNMSFLPVFGRDLSMCVFKERDAHDLADKMQAFFEGRDMPSLAERCRDIASGFSLPRHIDRISNELKIVK